MAHNTTRLGLNVVDGTDAVSAFPVADNQSKTILDTAVTFTSGTLVARPAAALNGRIYYATDNGQYYLDSGSSWQTMLVAGAWQALSLATSVAGAPGAYTPSARVEGDIVRLKGSIQNNTGGAIAGGTRIFTVPSSTMYPGTSISLAVEQLGSGTSQIADLSISTLGVATFATTAPSSWGNAQFCILDGLTYSLS